MVTDISNLNDETVQKLTRQLKLLNFWITFFGSLILISMIITGVLVFKAFIFVRDAEQKISDIQTKTNQTLNVQDDLCTNAIVKQLGLCKTQ